MLLVINQSYNVRYGLNTRFNIVSRCFFSTFLIECNIFGALRLLAEPHAVT